MKNYRRNNYIGKMKKGFKQKLSLLMIACLLFTGYRGLTISGRADSSHTEQNNEIEVSGSQVKVQLLGADLRRAATEAILKGEKVGKSNLRSYSKDQELATEFEEYFDGEKEIYNIPLNSIAENLEESLNAEEAGLQIYVERDAKDLDRLVRKESKESLLLYSKESAVAGLLPKKEEATTVSLTEEKASDSNLERNTELTGSELITFVYENKSTERMTFQLSVDGNKYPKVTVASKTSLFKQFLSDAKKAQAEAKNAKATEAKVESTEAQTVEASKVEENSTEAKQEVVESKATEATKATEESKASEEARKDDSEVAIVSTAAEAVAESTEAKAEVKTEASEEATEAKVEATETEVKETVAKAETAQAEKATEAQKAVVEDSSLLKDITEHSEEILPELQSIRFTQYSLNELGRKSQNVEIEGFGNVQVFYDEAAFDSDVVLEAKRLFKPEEEAEGEKLSEEQVKILKDEALYDDSASLDIRFVDKKDSTTEVEPKSSVAVRITIEKKALPEEAKAEDISIHHIVEEKGTEQPVSVETVSRSDKEKGAESNLEVKATEEKEVKVADSEDKISKEFTVSSFSAYVVHWGANENNNFKPIRFHYVDESFNEIAPTTFSYENLLTSDENKKQYIFQWSGNEGRIEPYQFAIDKKIYKAFYGYVFSGVYGQKEETSWNSPYVSKHYNAKVKEMTTYDVKIEVEGTEKTYIFSQDCIYHDYYFVYKPCLKNQSGNKGGFSEPSIIKDKYITKLGDEEYELTLTGQVKRGKEQEAPQPVDILFVYDNTGNISPEDAKATKQSIGKLMDEISSLPKSYDPRYALVTMDGEKAPELPKANRKKYSITDGIRHEGDGTKVSYDDKILILEESIQNRVEGFKIVGSLGDLRKTDKTSSNYKISDETYNDSRQNYGFTSNKEEIKNKLNTLQPSPAGSTGANYYAAIRNVKSLMQTTPDVDVDGSSTNRLGVFDNSSNFDSRNKNVARENSRKIVIFIAGGDATRTYIKENGTYEDYIKVDKDSDKTNIGYWLTRTSYKKGQSIGNGKKVYFPALNDARGEVRSFTNIDAFYSIGIGDESKWKYLDELTMASTKDYKYNRGRVLPQGIKYKLYKGTSATALKEIVNSLRNEIADTQVENILIKDTLSKYVKLIDGKNSVEGRLYKKSGLGLLKDTEIKKENWPALGLTDIKAEPTEVDGKTVLTLETVPKDFVLRPGYEIRLIAKVKPTSDAYNDINDPRLRKEGQPRTDLNDIYEKDGFDKVDDKGQTLNPEKYGTSVKKKGLYTNDIATISYKYKNPKDPTPKTPTEEYNKPIIHVKEKDTGYLKVYKGFVGFGDKLYNKETQEWTALGKDVLKKVSFDVYMQMQNRPDELITTVNLGDQKWIDSKFDSTKTYQLDNGYVLKINPVESGVPDARNNEPKYSGHRFVFEIDDLPKGLKYRIVEKIEGETVKELEGKHKTYTLDSYTYKYNGNELLRKTAIGEEYNLMPANPSGNPDGNTYVFNNFYELTEKNIKIKIRKEVQELGGMPFSKEAKQQSFDFYLALYRDEIIEKDGKNVEVRKSYSKEKLEDVIKELNPDVKYLDGDKEVPVEVIEVKNIQATDGGGVQADADADDITHYAIHFKLKHDAEISFMLKKGMKYRVYEKKTDGYNRPTYSREVVSEQTGKTITKNADVLANEGLYYTCSTYKIVEEETITWKNPRITMVPTGLVRDITPFVWGIFGFITMAGAYFAINKKRREA